MGEDGKACAVRLRTCHCGVSDLERIELCHILSTRELESLAVSVVVSSALSVVVSSSVTGVDMGTSAVEAEQPPTVEIALVVGVSVVEAEQPPPPLPLEPLAVSVVVSSSVMGVGVHMEFVMNAQAKVL